jgi:hypothetical protein
MIEDEKVLSTYSGPWVTNINTGQFSPLPCFTS